MNKDFEKIEKIRALLELEVPHETIEKVLELSYSVEYTLHSYDRQKDILTTQQAAEEIGKVLNGKVPGAWDIQKVRRLRQKGELEPVDESAAKKDGFLFDRTEIQRFIEEQLITKAELLAQRKQQASDYLNLEIELMDTKKERDELKKENQRLKKFVNAPPSDRENAKSESEVTEVQASINEK